MFATPVDCPHLPAIARIRPRLPAFARNCPQLPAIARQTHFRTERRHSKDENHHDEQPTSRLDAQ